MSSIYNNYFLSNKIKVFPCAYRNSTYDVTARLNTEYNFTHLPHTIDKASYIIEFTSKKLICAIKGYYFEIELDDSDPENKDSVNLENKYLNICVASPNGAGSIESPHLCSWNSNNIEAGLDLIQATSSSSVYIFTGLQISELTKENPSGTLSREGYQCYALKLDASAKLPISTNKIEDSAKDNAGVPISSKFTTGSISTTSLNAKSLIVKNNGSTILEAHPSGITAYQAVQIKSSLTSNSLKSTSLNIETDSTNPILKAGSKEVTIHKPTTITGANSNLTVAGTGKFSGKLTVTAGGADITGTTQIKKSSSGATDGNLKVAGIGEFGGKLTVTSGGAKIVGDTIISGTTGITGKATIGSSDTKTEIENDTIKTSKITIEKASNTGSLVIDKKQDNIIEIKDKSNTPIFSVNTDSGVTYAKQINADNINATVEGTIDKAVNVTTSIAGTPITNIFGSTSNKIDKLKLRIIEPDTDATWDSGADQSVKIILKKDTDPAKTKAVSFFLAKGGTATVVKADEFIGVAETAQAFDFPATISLSGDVSGKAESKYGWTIKTTINDSAVTNDKLANSSIKIGSKSVVALGGSIGKQDTPFIGDLYFGKQKSGNGNDCSIIITGQYTKNDTEYPLKILDYNGNTLIQFTNNYGVFNTTSVPKQIIYAATDSDKTKGKTELFGDKICIYAQGQDGLGGTIKAGMVDLSAHESNSGLWIRNIKQIHVNNASLKSSSLVRVNTNKVYLGSTNYGAAIDSTETDATFIINSAKTSGDMLQIKRLLDGGANVKKVFSVDYDGNVTANTYNAKSDRRLKENIIDYKPEKSILDLPVKKFDFIDGPKNQIGCIAQDLKEICPEIVNENEKGYLSIQESKLVYLLLDEVKKLKNEVEELKRN